jgi:signal transduction histidine kinase
VTGARSDGSPSPLAALAVAVAAGSLLAVLAVLAELLLPNGGSGGAALAAALLVASFFALLATTASAKRRWEAAAAAESRRQVALELHDGLAQELALLVLLSKQGAQAGTPDRALEDVADASQRALDEARHVIATLKEATLP